MSGRQRILITGASSGIGQQLARDYLAEGHYVYCCGRKSAPLVELVRQFPGCAEQRCFDITERAACRQMLGNLEALDLAILNAGTCEYIQASQLDAACFERVTQTNVIGVANCLEMIIPLIRPGGRLALMGSSSSYLPLPRAEAYGASKAAIEYLAKTLAVTLSGQSVGVTYIAPGFVETPLTDLNDFPMPMRVDVKTASGKIIKGLAKGRREIHFPRAFTGLLKCIGALPGPLQQFIVSRAVLRS